MRLEVSVVIVNYNGARLLPQCLTAVYDQTYAVQEIIVVDNGSADDSCQKIRQDYPAVKLIENGKNFFFCRGTNIGIAASASPFILLLNNDCMLDDNYIEETLKPMLEDEKIGASSGKIFRIDGETLDCCGQELSRSRKPVDRGYGIQDGGQYDLAEEVLSPGGVAPLVRREMLEDVALEGQIFDEDFVQYYEDLDLFWRARNFGWKSWYVPTATARHHRGASGQSEKNDASWVSQFAFANLPQFLQGHLLKNRLAVMVKNDHPGSWFLALPWILIYEIKVFAYILLVRPALFPVYLRGIKFLKKAFRKRKLLKQRVIDRGITIYGKVKAR